MAISTAAVLPSHSPATGEFLGEVPITAPDAVQAVVDDVRQVQPFWAQLQPRDRGRYLKRAAQVIIDETDQIRDLIAREQGKPRVEAFAMEVLPTIDACHWIANEGPAFLATEKIATPQVFFKTKRSQFVKEPLGVVGVIAPWNYPWSIPFGEIAIALMCGNGVVLKPATHTCLIGERIREVFERAGLPEGLVRTVHGPGTGSALVDSDVDKIFFTGSVEVGRGVGEACARQLKGSVLELGGKDPMIVLPDADLDLAVGGALWGGFANAGQTCAGIERAYVVREVAEHFTDELVRRVEGLRIGDPLDWRTEIGPMIDADQHALVRELVDDAVAAGATLRCGGPIDPPPGLTGHFFAPAVLTGVTHEMRIMQEEIFGPVLPVIAVDDESEALRLANDSRFGLGASVWTRDRATGERMARELQAGMVWINDHMYSHGAMQCSWSGIKESGLGIAHSRYGFDECCHVKLRVWDGGHVRNVWWQPYDETLGRALQATARVLYGRESQRAAALKDGAAPLLKTGRRILGSLRSG